MLKNLCLFNSHICRPSSRLTVAHAMWYRQLRVCLIRKNNFVLASFTSVSMRTLLEWVVGGFDFSILFGLTTTWMKRTLSLLIIRAPSSPLANLALQDLDRVCRLLKSTAKTQPFCANALVCALVRYYFFESLISIFFFFERLFCKNIIKNLSVFSQVLTLLIILYPALLPKSDDGNQFCRRIS